ncbi:UNVERIFIED_CONTAM: hypothetical protein GTU68_015315 [Idotea baltica]|nr:hypothetical protein [Idotea baltica]
MAHIPAAVGLTHAQIDITDPENLEQVLRELNINRLINTAAYNLVDAAEDNPESAFAVNAFGARNIAQWCDRNKVALLHVSTDHVFGNVGESTPLKETDHPLPNSVYGASKLAGEYFVQAECVNHYIVRTCGLYGHAATRAKGNFVNTMQRLGTERDELKVVADQYCTPTSTVDLAKAIAKLIETEQFGTYHMTNSGETTWYDFAAEIFRITEIEVDLLPISTEEFNAKAARPKYSVLNCEKLEATIGQKTRSWQEALAEYTQ